MCDGAPSWFLVNGVQSDGPVRMRFLYANDCHASLSLQIDGREVALRVTGTTPRVLELSTNSCETRRRIPYSVVNQGVTLLRGEYPVVPKSCKDDLDICFYSCNDAATARKDLVPKWHKPLKPYFLSRCNYDTSLWRQAMGSDLVVCLGDFIYADSVYDDFVKSRIDIEEVRRRIALLYRLAFTEPAQQAVMTTSCCACILDDHEVANGYGTGKNTPANGAFAAYMHAALGVYRTHAGALSGRRNVGDEGWCLSFGKYNFIAVDMRTELYRSGAIFTPRSIARTISQYDRKRHNILLLPRPLDAVNPLLSWYEPDTTLHINQIRGTICLVLALRLLPGIQIVAGDVHGCYASRAFGIPQFVTSGINVPTVYDAVPAVRVFKCVSDSLNELLMPKRHNASKYNNLAKLHGGSMTFVTKARCP